MMLPSDCVVPQVTPRSHRALDAPRVAQPRHEHRPLRDAAARPGLVGRAADGPDRRPGHALVRRGHHPDVPGGADVEVLLADRVHRAAAVDRHRRIADEHAGGVGDGNVSAPADAAVGGKRKRAHAGRALVHPAGDREAAGPVASATSDCRPLPVSSLRRMLGVNMTTAGVGVPPVPAPPPLPPRPAGATASGAAPAPRRRRRDPPRHRCPRGPPRRPCPLPSRRCRRGRRGRQCRPPRRAGRHPPRPSIRTRRPRRRCPPPPPVPEDPPDPATPVVAEPPDPADPPAAPVPGPPALPAAPEMPP